MQNNSFIGNLTRGISKRVGRFILPNNGNTGIGWFREKYLKHAKAGKLRYYAFRGEKLYYSNPSEFLHTMREIFDAEIYHATLPENALIIDCGANIGISTVYLKLQNPSARLIAFEPDEANFKILQRNIQSFKLQQVEARQEAVWIEDTTLNFASDGNMGSKIDSNSHNSVQVKATRLKTLLNQRVDFLKIDIEGAEYEVIKDVKEELKNVQHLFLEYHGRFTQSNELTDLFRWIQSAGFHYYIKEAAPIYASPFTASEQQPKPVYDVQLNIFCFRS